MTEQEVRAIFEAVINNNSQLGAPEIIAISSVSVAVIALVVAIYQLSAARRHNKLTVLPKMHFTSSTDNSSFFKISVANFGLGPAIIKEFVITLRGKQYTFPTQAVLTPVFSDCGYDIEPGSSMYLPSVGEAIMVGNTVRIFDFVCDAHGEYGCLRSSIEDLEIFIKFASMYGQTDECSYHFGQQNGIC